MNKTYCKTQCCAFLEPGNLHHFPRSTKQAGPLIGWGKGMSISFEKQKTFQVLQDRCSLFMIRHSAHLSVSQAVNSSKAHAMLLSSIYLHYADAVLGLDYFIPFWFSWYVPVNTVFSKTEWYFSRSSQCFSLQFSVKRWSDDLMLLSLKIHSVSGVHCPLGERTEHAVALN
jgi:hypothetical protein